MGTAQCGCKERRVPPGPTESLHAKMERAALEFITACPSTENSLIWNKINVFKNQYKILSEVSILPYESMNM